MTARVRPTMAATLLTIVLPCAALAQATPFSNSAVDTQASTVGFTVSAHLLFTLKQDGRFNEFAGVVSYNPERPTDTRVDLTVYTASVDTKSTEHDDMLRSTDFFDVDHYPTMHFASTTVNVQPGGGLAVTGDLTIRGITKRLVLPVKMIATRHGGGPLAAFETHFQIDRTEFGLTGRPNWGGVKVSIGKKVEIHLVIAAARGAVAR